MPPVNIHLANLVERRPELGVCLPEIERAVGLISASYRAGGKLLLCGNGGSAADADHISGELLKGFAHKRRITGARRAQLGDALADQLQGSLPAIPLGAFTAASTAWANDCDSEYMYAQLVNGLGKPGDVLLGISTSGNAKNVAHAVDVANRTGLVTIGLTGSSGGRLKNLAQACIRVPAKETYLIQELHLSVYHCLCLLLEDVFFCET